MITDEISSYIWSIGNQEFNKVVLDKAKLHLIDAIWCYFWSFWSYLWDKYDQYILQTSLNNGIINLNQVSMNHKAFFIAWMINACDFDDTSISWWHPWATIIGAIFAYCTKFDVKLSDALKAIICGYDIIHCIKKGTEPTWDRYNLVHWIWTTQTFWAYSALATLSWLSKSQIANGLWICWAISPVPHACKYWWWTKELISLKDNVAFASQSWVQAFILTQTGFIWNTSIFDGEDSFYIMASSDVNNILHEAQWLWEYYSILDASIKPYPCCRWIHCILDCIDQIWWVYEYKYPEIQEIYIETLPSMVKIFDNKTLVNIVTAQFSIQYNVTMMLLWVPRIQWWKEETMVAYKDKILDIYSKIKLLSNDNFLEEYLSSWKNPSNLPAIVTFHFRNWTKIQREVHYSRWSSQNKISDTEFREKFLENVSNFPKIDWEKLFEELLHLNINQNFSKLLNKYLFT